ncbi:MAG: hypothetical protein WC375_10120 [Methanomassiliicoccales archaeon]|jgi:hypothetical protein
MNITHPQTIPHPWTETDIKVLATSRNFSDIGSVTLAVLLRFQNRVAMVSGPMTSGGKGSITENPAAYRRAMAHLQSKDYVIFNQLLAEDALKRHWHAWIAAGNEGYCWELLEEVYAPVFRSGKVAKLVFMPDWQSSRGATWEHEMAHKLGIETEYLPHNWEQ